MRDSFLRTTQTNLEFSWHSRESTERASEICRSERRSSLFQWEYIVTSLTESNQLNNGYNPLIEMSILDWWNTCETWPSIVALGSFFLFNPRTTKLLTITSSAKGGGGGHLHPPSPDRFSKWLHIKDQALACKQLWVSYLLSIKIIKF